MNAEQADAIVSQILTNRFNDNPATRLSFQINTHERAVFRGAVYAGKEFLRLLTQSEIEAVQASSLLVAGATNHEYVWVYAQKEVDNA